MKHYSANPIKLSQPAGAALAFMGVKGCVPLWHGSQGCTAFAKILFIQHFREPMPFQTTALTHTTVVMGGDTNAAEAMDNVRSGAKIIGLLTTGVTETSGADVARIAKAAVADNPGVPVVAVSVPDFEGSLQTGYVKACKAMLDILARPRIAPRRKQVAVFAGPYVTPGEVETIRDVIEDFGLRPVIFPDLGASLGGYLAEDEYSPATIGGTLVDEIETLADSAMVMSVGNSMNAMAKEFSCTHGIEHFHFDSLATLDEMDGFLSALSSRFKATVPGRYIKQRRRFLDTALDTQFYLNGKKAAVAGDPEFVTRWAEPLTAMGMKVTAVATPGHGDWPVGDLEDLRGMIESDPVDILIGNSHVAELAGELGLPAIRSGIPVSDRIGEPQTVRLGYNGASALLMELANAFMGGARHAEPYISTLRAGV